MLFFLDENMPLVVVGPFRVVFRTSHDFVHATHLNLTGTDDVDLYPLVRRAGAGTVISKDGRQLKNQTERRGLYDNRLSFIHLRQTRAGGPKGVALDLAALIAGLPYLDEVLMNGEPAAVRLRGLQSGFTERVASNVPLWLDSWGDRA